MWTDGLRDGRADMKEVIVTPCNFANARNLTFSSIRYCARSVSLHFSCQVCKYGSPTADRYVVKYERVFPYT